MHLQHMIVKSYDNKHFLTVYLTKIAIVKATRWAIYFLCYLLPLI